MLSTIKYNPNTNSLKTLQEESSWHDRFWQLHQLMQTFCLFCTKNYFFYFIHKFLQNTHINLSIVHIYLIKYSFFYNFFFIISSLTTLLSHKPNTTENTKILNARATVTVHLVLCTVTIALVHLCTIYTHWCGFFWLKMCKMDYFLYFAWVDTIALR